MIACVLDASAWIRLFIPDGPMPAGLESAVRRADMGEAFLASPELVLVDMPNALHRKRAAGYIRAYIRAGDVGALWADIRRLPVNLTPLLPDIDQAIDLARELNLTVYDACYAALARRLGAGLLTADKRLEKAVRRIGLILQ